MKTRSMADSITYKGYWWTPDNPEDKVAGVVTCIPHERIGLELIGSFKSGSQDPFEAVLDDAVEQVIYGEESGAKEITLINCRKSGSCNFDCSFPIIRYSASILIHDKHVASLDQKCNYTAVVRFPELSYWCIPSAIETRYQTVNGRIEEISLSYKCAVEPKDTIVSVTLDDGTVLSINQGVNYSSGDLCLRPELKQYSYLEITNPEGLSINEISHLVHRFEMFLSMATFRSVNHEELYLKDPDICQEMRDGRKIFFPIHLYDSYSIEENSSKINMINFLFSYKTISDEFPELIRKWMSNTGNMQPIMSHLVDSIAYKRVFSSVDFLVVIQAIEGFWWRFKDDEYKRWNGIGKKRQTPLETILKELLKEFDDVPAVHKLDLGVSSAVDSRHVYSHLLEKGAKPDALDGADLLFLTRKLRVLLICCILSHYGLSHNKLTTIFDNCHNDCVTYLGS